jgi:hypothetical protein
MKKAMLVMLMVLVAAALAMATIPPAPQGTSDVLGAHLLYGRGCIGCHAPHSGAGGNGFATSDTTSGNAALWGEDLTPLYSKTATFGDAPVFGRPAWVVNFPAAGTVTNPFDPVVGIMFCLSCHDGNVATGGHMKNTTVEALPVFGGNAPTLLGNDKTTVGNYANDHPVGPVAKFTCGGPYDWDCTLTGATVNMTGTASSKFAGTNYGFAVSLANYSNTPVVTCTSCHDQHSQNIYEGQMGGTVGSYQTMFFLRGYYNPNTGGNSAAQFCRQCHGGESNEMHGQMNVPTT